MSRRDSTFAIIISGLEARSTASYTVTFSAARLYSTNSSIIAYLLK